MVDGNSLIHRAFHALPLLANGRGIVTNAVYGFTTMFLKVLSEQKPEYVAVAFDKGKPVFRAERYQDYKGQRPETSPLLGPQFDLVKRVLAAMRVPVFELDGYEADDIIGTLVRQAGEQSLESLILTGDRDALQLLAPRVKVLLTRKGISQMEIYAKERVAAEYGLAPEKMADLKGLMGDKSDNIPGVPGIGEKTALDLLHRFGSLEEVLARLDEVPRRKTAELLAEYADQARLSRDLATIDCRVPLEVDWEALRLGEADYPALLEVFRELEFSSLIPEVEARMGARGMAPPAGEGVETECFTAWKALAGPEELRSLSAALATGSRLADYEWAEEEAAVFVERDKHGRILAVGLAVPGEVSAAMELAPEVEPGQALSGIAPLLKASNLTLYWHDVKAAAVQLAGADLTVPPPAHDTMIAAYLLDPGTGRYSLPQIAADHLNWQTPGVFGPAGLAAWGAEVILEAAPILEEKLRLAGMNDLYHQVELPLALVLAEMEATGIGVDLAELEKIGTELAEGMEVVAAEIYEMAGETFNLNSPKQLAAILFGKLDIAPLKKTKTGYSTGAEVLEELAPDHPIAAKVLEYRTLMKLKSTYIDGLAPLVNPRTGRLHTTFHQTVTATGRLSSSEPNLQNIPVRLELGRRIRRAFIPRPGWVMLAADYSQIELRLLAHISGDASLIRAFREGEDIHTRTAAEVLGVTPEEVTYEMRRQAKAVNFGIVYGITDYGLSQDLGISRDQAAAFITRYFDRYPGVREYTRQIVAQARDQGYVTTLLGRRRYLGDLFSSSYTARKFGERTAMNTPIQGSAADLIKLAMVRLAQAMREHGFAARMLLQVHDELIFEVPPEEVADLANLAKNYMETAMELAVPLKVDLQVGPNWYDMEDLAI